MRVAPACLLILTACEGSFFAPRAIAPRTPGQSLEALEGPPTRTTVARRLTRQELQRSVHRLLGADAPVDVSLLPDDALTPFDNDVIEQSPSLLLVESMEGIAQTLAAWVVASPDRLARVVPCTPANATDAVCFQAFLQQFGTRALRRPLSAEEIASFSEVLSYAQASGQFKDAVAVALRVFFLHPELIYRTEPGLANEGGRIRLSSFEVATRLSFLLQGMTPDDQLLAAAADGSLGSAEGLQQQAERLIASPEGKEQIRRFHAFWLSYSTLNALPIEQKLRAETDALVDRATEANQDFHYLLLADETRIDAELAAHYSLAPPASAEWVSYGDAPRRGVISHGMFAEAGAKFGDTSPTRRGKFVRERFLCQTVQFPTVDVDIDLPPMAKTPNACKTERYKQHREDQVCAGCHALMDPIGFGLENFDELGRFRAHDKDRPECVIDGAGQLDASTPFTGAKELASLIAASPRFEPCVGEFYIRFAAGRQLDPRDNLRAQWLGRTMKDNNGSFVAMALAYVTHDNFRYRDE